MADWQRTLRKLFDLARVKNGHGHAERTSRRPNVTSLPGYGSDASRNLAAVLVYGSDVPANVSPRRSITEIGALEAAGCELG